MRFHPLGYTLTEVMVTIVVLGALVSLALPNYTTFIERSRAGEGVSILSLLREAQLAHRLENGVFADDLSDLVFQLKTVPQYFEDLDNTNVDSSEPIATVIKFNDPIYSLSIDSDGTITCTVAAGDICSKIGY